MLRLLASALSIAALTSAPGSADDITDTLNEALAAYQAGDIAEAKELTTFAAELLNGLRGDALSNMLPDMDGWEKVLSDDGGGMAAAASMMGGGVGVSAEYTKDADEVTLSIITESPMMAIMAPMMTSSAAMGSMGKVKRISGEKVVLSNEGQIMSLIDNRFMIVIEGLDDSEAMIPFFEAIDIEALEAF